MYICSYCGVSVSSSDYELVEEEVFENGDQATAPGYRYQTLVMRDRSREEAQVQREAEMQVAKRKLDAMRRDRPKS